MTEIPDLLSMPPVITGILKKRGIETEEQLDKFIRPKLEGLTDPFYDERYEGSC